MSEERTISDEARGAFVDGELDPAEWAGVAERMERDAALREELSELRTLKDLVRHAYAVPPGRRARVRRAALPGWKLVAAASVVLTVSGWLGHAWWSGTPVFESVTASAVRGDGQATDGNRVLVHVSSDRQEALGRALDEVEDLLRSARAANRGIEVEIVANLSGLALLRAGASSPYAPRLTALRREYPNLSLVACGQTMQRGRESGQPFELLPGTAIAPSALERVVARLRSGWVYVRV